MEELKIVGFVLGVPGAIAALIVIYNNIIKPRRLRTKLLHLASLLEAYCSTIGMRVPSEVDLHEKYISERSVEDYIRENMLGGYKFVFSEGFKLQYCNSLGYKASDEIFERLALCPASGVPLAEYWTDLRLALDSFLAHYGEGNPGFGIATVENRLRLFRQYANSL